MEEVAGILLVQPFTNNTAYLLLAVDDDVQVLHLVRRTLETEGYRVITADSGEAAVAAFEQQPPDLVVLDIKMPGLNGYQVLERIRETSNVPVIMLTAVREETAMERSLGLGASDYIIKQVSIKVLIARVKAKLRRADLGRPQPQTGDQLENKGTPS